MEGRDRGDPQWYHACAYETVRALVAALGKAGLEIRSDPGALASVNLTRSCRAAVGSAPGQAILVCLGNKPGDKVESSGGYVENRRCGSPVPKS
jgi:hypothetical protein